MQIWPRSLSAFLMLTALLTGCSAPPKPVVPPASQTPKAAWQPVLDNGSADLFYAAPDGSGYLFREAGTVNLLHVSADDSTIRAIVPEMWSYAMGRETFQVPVAQTPYGRMLVGERPDSRHSLSPDGRRLAVARNGLWIVDLESGNMTRMGSEPQPPPAPLVKHQAWEWATYPSWSADGQWIDFYATREQPNQFAHWRVAVATGQEELVSREETGPYPAALLPEGLTGPSSTSPDRRWALVLVRERPALVVVEVASGRTREVPLPPGADAGLEPIWNGDQVLFRTRPVRYDGPHLLSILDLPSGKLTHYAGPDPAGADIWPLGWAAGGKVLARILPLPDSQAGTAPQGAWLLDPSAYSAPKPAAPGALRFAGLAGPGPAWSQLAGNAPVSGGEASTVPQAFLMLRFDQPLDEAWIRQAVQVEGPGAVEAHGAALGMAIVRLDGAKAGEIVRVQVPAFQFDLRLRVGPGE